MQIIHEAHVAQPQLGSRRIERIEKKAPRRTPITAAK
jgi:hypothetical protein